MGSKVRRHRYVDTQFSQRLNGQIRVVDRSLGMAKTKPTVLILCTGNSCRSHMAGGILRASAGDQLDVQSAGSDPAGHVHPLAVRVMREIGIDISHHRSKHLDEFISQDIETVIIVCSNAGATCPVFPGQAGKYHWPFDDPAKAGGGEDAQLAVFRRVRDEIRVRFEGYARERLGELS